MSVSELESDDGNAIVQYLAEHPRLIGALFTAFLLLSQAGSAAANACASNNGI